MTENLGSFNSENNTISAKASIRLAEVYCTTSIFAQPVAAFENVGARSNSYALHALPLVISSYLQSLGLRLLHLISILANVLDFAFLRGGRPNIGC
jgi:uncharacterized protein with ATP-grasp and redox domains